MNIYTRPTDLFIIPRTWLSDQSYNADLFNVAASEIAILLACTNDS